MKQKIKVIIKNHGSKPYTAWISPKLENLQKHVGGYIESIYITNDAAILCNEEGLINEMDYNCDISGIPFHGPVIFIGVNGDRYDDFPMEWKQFKQAFSYLF